MAVSILLLHRAAIFFGCPIKYKPLILCAVMAFLVNFATLNISPFLTPTHYALILAFVLTASLGVTFYNTQLLKKERRAASASIRGKPPQETAASSETTDEPPADEETKTPVSEPTANEKTETPSASETPADAEADEPTAEEAPADAEADEPAAEETPADAEAEEPSAEETPSDAEAEEPLADDEDDEDFDLEPAVPPSEEERKRAKEELRELTEAVGRLHSMDDYLDYADQEARAHRPRRAVFAYKQALSLYWNDGYAPFIAINLSNVYKEMGDYEAASDTYKAALTLPAAQKNAAMQQEFFRSADYLRTVHHILASHGIADTPFAQIPPEISAEIERAVQEADAANPS